MFDFVQKHRRLIQIFLALCLVPFAFFGVDAYFRSDLGAQNAASVGGVTITAQEFDRALRERQSQLRQMAGGTLDPQMLDTPELRYAVLEGLLQQRLLLGEAVRERVVVPDAALRQYLTSVQYFRDETGKFSPERYQELLRARGETPVNFENGVRRELMIGTLADAYGETGFVSQTVARRLAALNEQQREISVHQLPPDAYLGAVKLDPEAAKKYYDSHASEFQTPEQVKVEFLAVSLDQLAAKETVTAEELKEAYEANRALYARAEQRRISHILIAVDPKASEDDKKAARLKADRLMAEAKASPAAFAAVAKRESQDPGSAAKGGDLGLLPRGALNDMPALEDLAFSIAPGETGGPVATRFGLHLVRVGEVKMRSFDEVKAQLEAEIRKRKAQKRYAELGEDLDKFAFETPDSLKLAAEKLKLPLQTSGWLTRSGGADKLLDNPKLLKAVFSEEALKDRRNTTAIDTGSAIIAARVVDHKPVGTKPYADVSSDITRQLTRERAIQLAAEDGRARLAKLKAGQDAGFAWPAPKLASRGDPQGLPLPALVQAFKLDTEKLPAYAGAEDPRGGYVLVRVSKVAQPAAPGADKLRAVSQQLSQLRGQEELAAVIGSLRGRTDVNVNSELLENKKQ